MQKERIKMSVNQLKTEIKSDLKALESRYLNERVKRQLIDGKDFLEMLDNYPYKKCTSVSFLINVISSKRDKLKKEYNTLEVYAPGHQYTFLDIEDDEAKADEMRYIERRKELQKEIDWLHKCLGICHNPGYFK